MNFKSVISVLIIFSVLFAFCGCKKLESSGEYEIVTNLYAEDDIGETHAVETTVNDNGETEYYYVDNSGNVVEVESKAVKTEKKTVKVTTTSSDGSSETYSVTPEQQSFLDEFNNAENIEKYVEEETVTFETGEEIAMDSEKVDQIVEEAKGDTQNTPSPQHETVEDYYKNLANEEKYYIEMNMKIVSDDEVTTMPVKIARNGSKFFMELSMPVSEEGNMKAQIYVLNGKCTMYVPAMKAYMEIPSDMIDEMYDSLKLATQKDDTSKFVASTNVTVDGKKYNVDIYEANDGATVLYYYDNNELKRIESEYDSHNYSILEYTKTTTDVNDNLFVAPKGYFNMTDLIDNGSFGG